MRTPLRLCALILAFSGAMSAAFSVALGAAFSGAMGAAFSGTVGAQTTAPVLERVYIGADFLAHIVDGAGKDISIAAESEQKAVSKPQLSPDKRVAGWQIETENCCTSYTIPTRLMIDRNKKALVIEPGQMIYDWCFADSEGAQVAISVGPTHGAAPRHLLLYNTITGHQVKQWTGDPNAPPPDWAARLTQ